MVRKRERGLVLARECDFWRSEEISITTIQYIAFSLDPACSITVLGSLVFTLRRHRPRHHLRRPLHRLHHRELQRLRPA